MISRNGRRRAERVAAVIPQYTPRIDTVPPRRTALILLLSYVAEGKVKLNDIITHRLPLTEIEHAYSIFQKKEDNCVKVVLDRWF
jgi:threonine dehydrogenase-like Zn-dependent dehydrogenase